MRRAVLFLIIGASVSISYCIAQENESIDQVVYLIGNTAARKICIYGLDRVDIFNVSGSAQKSILVRIIGGPGTFRNVQFGVKNHWKALMGEWDAGINAGYGGFFFGLVNNI